MKILEPYRKKIDSLDDQIVDLLVEREKIIHEVAALKKKQGIAPVLQDRVDEVRERNVSRAKAQGGSAEMMREIYKKIIKLSCDLEEAVKNDQNV
jgi:chorismate mutase